MKTEKLTLSSEVSDYPEEAIKDAMSVIEMENPLTAIDRLIDGMKDLIVCSDFVDEEIKNIYFMMYSHLLIHIKLLKYAAEQNDKQS